MNSASWAQAREWSATCWGLWEPYPLPDAAQVFQGGSGRGAFGLGHDRLRDDVVAVGDIALLAPVRLLP